MICYCCCVYKVSSSGFDADEVARVIEETFKCYNNPGLAVSVVKDGKVSTHWSFTDSLCISIRKRVRQSKVERDRKSETETDKQSDRQRQ